DYYCNSYASTNTFLF
nr:immunoglobulin light chain junction region [Macaca mulatta]